MTRRDRTDPRKRPDGAIDSHRRGRREPRDDAAGSGRRGEHDGGRLDADEPPRSGRPGRSPNRAVAAEDDRPAWRDRVDELLLAGERVRERVTAGEHAFVVTSHRVLSFRPAATDGPNFRAVERPNVVDVRTETDESLRLLGWAFVLGVVGTLLMLVGVSVDFAGMVPTVEGAGPATGSVQGTIDSLSSLLAAFGQLVAVGGLLLVLGGLVAFGQYARTRSERLVIAVAGDRDLTAPKPAEPERTVFALERAIEAEPVADHGGPVGVRVDGTPPMGPSDGSDPDRSASTDRDPSTSAE